MGGLSGRTMEANGFVKGTKMCGKRHIHIEIPSMYPLVRTLFIPTLQRASPHVYVCGSGLCAVLRARDVRVVESGRTKGARELV